MTTKEPDISCLKVYENPLLVSDTAVSQQASLTVVEIKRPMRRGLKAGESEEKDPILQALNYLKRLREGATTKAGRKIPNADRIPGFVYVLADLTDQMEDCCILHQLTKTLMEWGILVIIQIITHIFRLSLSTGLLHLTCPHPEGHL